MSDYPGIEVYCDDRSTRSLVHRARTARIITFTDIDGRWIVLRPDKWAERKARQPAKDAALERAMRGGGFDNDAYLAAMTEELGEGYDVPEATDSRDAHGQPARFDDKFAHVTYKMKCPLCGLDVQRRHEAVSPVLEKLRAAGVDRISLTALSARMG